MENKQFFIGMVFASIIGGGIALGGYELIREDQPVRVIQAESQNVRFSNNNLDTSNIIVPEGMNFVSAAKTVTAGVVHIRSTFEGRSQSGNSEQFDQYFRQFFGDPNGHGNQQRPSIGTGSGVIISADGYIATNNHVIKDATEIEVLLNDNRTYKAKIVGTDPTTDLALLKVDASELPFVRVGDSDQVQVGEWVLAVGNPFEFRSTVTAGIISAKGRNIDILRRSNSNNLQIESFLQTDAAVNPGNSGGALVNLRGELVGINTAIATPTGTYAGYSFAVPSNLVNKVLGDLKEFGVVQRALLGINIRDVNSQLAEEEELTVLEGVYVINVNPKSGAEDAGIKNGDVIIAIGNERVRKTSELQEKVALNRPGDKIEVTLIRDGKERKVTATLKNTLGTTTTIASNNNIEIQGGVFSDVSEKEKEALNIAGGAKLTSVKEGKWSEAGIKKGFIVTAIDKRAILNVEDLSRALIRTSGDSGLLIEGVYENGEKAYYGIGW